MSNRLVTVELYPLRLPFRRVFSHAAAQRASTETVVAAATLADGTVGYGEGLPRSYVTGETVESVIRDVNGVLADQLSKVEPEHFADLLELADQLPFVNRDGQNIHCARCCVELALLDAYGKSFHRPMSSVAGWLGFGRFASFGEVEPIRVSGVLSSGSIRKAARQYRLMRLYGLRDFKLKMGTDQDEQALSFVRDVIWPDIKRGKVTLRVDANGAWDVDAATGMSDSLSRLGVVCLEQPLAKDDQSHWRMLADLTKLPLMADESLVSMQDAEFLVQNDLVDFFNIRISKNGGLLPSIRLAEMGLRHHRRYQLGAMVGESGILAAAGIHFLQLVPNTEFTEIGYSTLLLEQDILDRRIQFGYGGKLPRLGGYGLGVEVRRDRLEKFLVGKSIKIDFC